MENGRKLNVVACEHDDEIRELQRQVEELRMQVALITGILVVVTGLAGGLILMG